MEQGVVEKIKKIRPEVEKIRLGADTTISKSSPRCLNTMREQREEEQCGKIWRVFIDRALLYSDL